MMRLAPGIGAILVASVLFGAMAVCVRAATATMAPLEVAFVRFAGALVLMLATAGPGALRARRASHRVLVLRGLLGAGAISLWFHGIRDAGAAVATLLHATYPLWASLIAALVLGEGVSRRTALALVVELAGVVLVVGPGGGPAPHATRGALLSLLAGMLAGGAVATARQLRATESASVVTTWFMLVGMLLTAPSMLSGLPPPSWPLALALGAMVVTSAAGQWLLHHGLGFTTAARGSLAAATSIVTAAGLEAVWMGHLPRLHVLVGGGLMVTAVALATAGSGIAGGLEPGWDAPNLGRRDS